MVPIGRDPKVTLDTRVNMTRMVNRRRTLSLVNFRSHNHICPVGGSASNLVTASMRKKLPHTEAAGYKGEAFESARTPVKYVLSITRGRVLDFD